MTCRGATHIPKRWDEGGQPYDATADDAAYAIFELDGGIIAQFNSSWTTRVRRDDLLTLHVDGSKGSAVAGLRRCWRQSLDDTPVPAWNPDVPPTVDYWQNWDEVADATDYDNAFKIEWELFIRHLCEDAPFEWGLLEGAKGVQLAELGLQSWAERRTLDITALEV